MSSDFFFFFSGGARDTWDDRPYARESEREWDDSGSGRNYRDRSYDDDYEQEKDDSDVETRQNNHTNNVRKYRDTELPQSPTHVEKRVNINLNPSLVSSPKKQVKTIKKVDLGAAANFGRGASQSPVPPPGNDVQNDDFDPRASEATNQAAKAPLGEYGDFETAFGSSSNAASHKSDDGFADFSSAFSQPSADQNLFGSMPSTIPHVVPPPNLLTGATAQSNLMNASQPPHMSANQQNLMGTSPLGLMGAPQMNMMGAVPVNPAVQPGIVPVAPVQQSNTDLLADFGSLSIQPQGGFCPPPNNNVGFFGSGNTDLLDGLSSGSGDNVQKKTLSEYLSGTLPQRRVKPKNVLSERLLSELETCTVALGNIEKLTAQNQVEDVLSKIENLLQLLPGPITVQKLSGIDETFADSDFITRYEIFLESLVKIFDAQFPYRDKKLYEPIKNLFCMDDPFCFVVNLRVLSKYLKTGYKDCFISLLSFVLQSEGLFSYIFVTFCNINSKMILVNTDWDISLKLLASLPNRVANVSVSEISDIFQTDNYTKILLLNLLKVVEFVVNLTETESLENLSLDYNILSQLLSKVLLYFNMNLNSKELLSFIEIVAVLTNKPSDKISHYQNIFRNIFENLERPAVEILAKMLLSNLNPQEYLVVAILGKDMIQNVNWKFVMCTKIPMLVHFEKDYENLQLNLVMYLSVASEKWLIKLFTDLINIWADRTSINRTSVEQQIFVSKLILYIMNSLENIGLSDFEKRNIMGKVYGGIPIHLESSIPMVRYSGMKTGEILLNILRNEDPHTESVQMKFEYENLTDECKSVVTELQTIIDKDLEPCFRKKTEFHVNIEDLLDKLRVQNVKLVDYIPPERKFRTRKVAEEPKNEVTLSECCRNPKIKILNSTNFELDSDDDLEPYDLSNDVKVSRKQPPAYLRDLRDALVEMEDYETFMLALENCQNLVETQLPDDDAAIGLEILTILVSLEPRFYVENYEELLFQSCISITCIYPAYYAEYLCKQIHADVGTYSISKRIFMMDVLRQSAKSLASLKLTENVEEKKSKRQRDIDNAAEVIRKRLETKTRYFNRHKVVKKESVNRFSESAGFFFFPLLYGYNENKMLSQSSKDIDFIFLIHFVETLAVIMCAAQNCPVAPRMGKEVISFSWFLRYHKEVKVRMAVISLIASVVLNVPQSILVQDFMGELFEIRLWLSDLLSTNVVRGEPNTDCRNLAGCAAILIEGILKVDVDIENSL